MTIEEYQEAKYKEALKTQVESSGKTMQEYEIELIKAEEEDGCPELRNTNYMVHKASNAQVVFKGWKAVLREAGMNGLHDIILNYRVGTVNRDSVLQFLLFMGATTKCVNALREYAMRMKGWMNNYEQPILPRNCDGEEFIEMMFGVSTTGEFVQFCIDNVRYQDDALMVSDRIANGALFKSLFE